MPAPIQLLFDLGLDDFNPIEVGECENPPDMYIEPNAYFGFAEGDVCATFLQMTIDGDNESKLGLGLPVFSNVDATRTDDTVENQTPESMTFTINEDAWLTLTLPCTLIQ